MTKHNGTEIQGMTYNGQEVSTWIHNGVEVFSASEPFYWIQNSVVQSGYPSAYNVSSITSGTYYRNFLTGFYMTGNDNGNSTFKGVTNPVSTQRNKYMEVIVSSLYGGAKKLTIAGTTITATGTYVIDVRNMDTVTIAVELTAWAGGSEAGAGISSIRFYS